MCVSILASSHGNFAIIYTVWVYLGPLLKLLISEDFNKACKILCIWFYIYTVGRIIKENVNTAPNCWKSIADNVWHLYR